MKAALGLTEDDEFIPYCLRHTCATRLLQLTSNVVTVKEWLGHKDLATTLRYAHLDPSSLYGARDKLDGYQETKPQVATKVEHTAEELLTLVEKKLGLSKADLLKALEVK